MTKPVSSQNPFGHLSNNAWHAYHGWEVDGPAYPMTRFIWRLIELYPGSTFRELASLSGTCLSNVFFHVQRLREWGVVPPATGQARTLIARVPFTYQSYLTEEERCS